jgi:hypothetical protein
MFYGALAKPLQKAIESGQVTGMASALTFIEDFIDKEWDPMTIENGIETSLNKENYNRDKLKAYFTNLWTKNGKLDTDIPL